MQPWQRRVVTACALVLCLEVGMMLAVLVRTSRKDNPTTNHTHDTTLSHHHRQLQQQQQPPSRTPRTVIIGVGLPRTGADAVHDFFTCRGVTSRHYCCPEDNDNHTTVPMAFPCPHSRTCGACVADNWRKNRPAWQGCAGAAAAATTTMTAFLQLDVEAAAPYGWFLPQHGATLEALAADSADNDDKIVWILTQRTKAEMWATSVLHWHSITERLLRALSSSSSDPQPNMASLELQQPVTHPQVVASLEASIQHARESQHYAQRQAELVAAYHRHVEHVRTTAAALRVPLVEVIVDEEQDDQSLSQALAAHGVALPPTPNDASSCWNWQASKLDDDWRDFSFPF